MSKKVIFLDRDGVINKDLNSYVTAWDKFQFLPGAIEALKKLFDHDYEVAIISNQAGVARGDYTTEELEDISERMLAEIENAAGKRPVAYYCIHLDEQDCDCRKPKTGLIRKAEAALGTIDFTKTYLIGDQERDMQTAKNIGATSILVLSGKTDAERLASFTCKPDYVKQNLLEAVTWLLERGDPHS